MIATVTGRVGAKHAERVVVQTPGGVGYEVVVPLGVMERLPAVGELVTLQTELVVRDDGWALYGFLEGAERRLFQRLTSVSGVGPRLALTLLSTLGVARGARAVTERNIGLLSSVNGIGKKTAERLVLELADKLGEFADATAPTNGTAETALRALETLGYGPAEADGALRKALATDGAGASTDTLVRHALRYLATG
ncbi:MAG TPA: Holliday junction branch migration protein RuvA [Gemmatimonadales bacterium]|nr:Holliday junction branch migration protein RuvA [Gemmatimonadales bacterium]